MNFDSDTDYYQLLNLPSSASLGEIKKAFRKLAMRYHPDKNPENPKAAEKFSQIQQAYLVLSDKKLRTEYHFHRYAGKQKSVFTMPVADTAALVSLAEKLRHKVSLQDPFRIDTDQLYFEISSLLTEDRLALLQEENDPKKIQSFMVSLLPSAANLPFSQISILAEKLNPLVLHHPEASHFLIAFLRSSRQLYLWSRYKVWIALVITMLCCVLLYYLVKN